MYCNEYRSLSAAPGAGKEHWSEEIEPRLCGVESYKHSPLHLMVLGGSFIAVEDLFLPIGIQVTKKEKALIIG